MSKKFLIGFISCFSLMGTDTNATVPVHVTVKTDPYPDKVTKEDGKVYNNDLFFYYNDDPNVKGVHLSPDNTINFSVDGNKPQKISSGLINYRGSHQWNHKIIGCPRDQPDKDGYIHYYIKYLTEEDRFKCLGMGE